MPTLKEIKPRLNDVISLTSNQNDEVTVFVVDHIGLKNVVTERYLPGLYTYMTNKMLSNTDVFNDSSFFKLLSRTYNEENKEIVVGRIYMAFSGLNYEAIFEREGRVWMKPVNGQIAYVWEKNGKAATLSHNDTHDINWSASGDGSKAYSVPIT